MNSFKWMTLALVMVPSFADATVWQLSANGTVTSISGFPSTAPSGSLAIGDAFSIQILFDDWLVQPTNSPTSGGTQQQYVAEYQFASTVGSYSFSGTSGSAGNYLTFYNNWNACGSGGNCLVDAAYFSQVGFSQTTGSVPFDFGSDRIFQYLEASFFDGSASALDTADLSAIGELDRFANSTINFGFSTLTLQSRSRFHRLTHTQRSRLSRS